MLSFHQWLHTSNIHAFMAADSVPRLTLTQFLLIAAIFVLDTGAAAAAAAVNVQELLRGFTAKPDPSVTTFQAILSDSTGNYSLGFLRVNRTQLAVAVVHVPSSEQLWRADTGGRLARWDDGTRIFFNGSLVITDPHTRVFWSTHTDGDRVWLSNTSNIEIQKVNNNGSRYILWQSFDFPYNTLMENQNFTNAMLLVSSNGLYYMKMGSDFVGLYAKFNPGSDSDPGQIYWRHKALEAKADIIEGHGPVYLVLNPDGFLGMYQNGSTPVDVQSFSSFQLTGSGIRRVRVEPDGNLKGYYWTGSDWVLDYQAIPDPCELPSPCGSYGLCQPGKGCSCLDNRTDHNSGDCVSPENNSGGDFCSVNAGKYRMLTRNGVELPYKELMGYQKMDSSAQCASSCEENCTCWGAVYSNSSGFCYTLDYPIQTLVGVRDETKVGYFKVRESPGKRKIDSGLGIGFGLLGGSVLVLGGALWIWIYRHRKRNKEEEGVGPYKGLESASFRSIELSEK